MAPEKSIKSIKLDPKTEAVFRRKGYRLDKMLNEGAYGQVYKGTNTKTGELIALKVMNLAVVGDKFRQKFLPRELSALVGIRHENVIFIHDIFRADQKIYIFMELANGGDLTGYLVKNGAISELNTCFWFTQVTKAIQYIHDMHIAHRDIKNDNVLLHNNNAKVTDFGFAKESWDIQRNCPLLSETFCGTEIVSRKPYNPFCADSWAMGVMLFCMLNNRFPFHWGDSKAMLKEHTDPNFIGTRYTKKFPTDLRKLQEAFFVVEEANRITMAETLKHPWILRKGKGNVNPNSD